MRQMKIRAIRRVREIKAHELKSRYLLVDNSLIGVFCERCGRMWNVTLIPA